MKLNIKALKKELKLEIETINSIFTKKALGFPYREIDFSETSVNKTAHPEFYTRDYPLSDGRIKKNLKSRLSYLWERLNSIKEYEKADKCQ